MILYQVCDVTLRKRIGRAWLNFVLGNRKEKVPWRGAWSLIMINLSLKSSQAGLVLFHSCLPFFFLKKESEDEAIAKAEVFIKN